MRRNLINTARMAFLEVVVELGGHEVGLAFPVPDECQECGLGHEHESLAKAQRLAVSAVRQKQAESERMESTPSPSRNGGHLRTA